MFDQEHILVNASRLRHTQMTVIDDGKGPVEPTRVQSINNQSVKCHVGSRFDGFNELCSGGFRVSFCMWMGGWVGRGGVKGVFRIHFSTVLFFLGFGFWEDYVCGVVGCFHYG